MGEGRGRTPGRCRSAGHDARPGSRRRRRARGHAAAHASRARGDDPAHERRLDELTESAGNLDGTQGHDHRRGLEQLRARADPPPHAVGGARGRARLADGHRRGPAGRDAGARRQADRERGQRHPRHEHARPARGARRRRLRDRRDRRGRHGRVGRRPRDPGPLRHRHADRRLARAGRDHARLPQRPRARAGRPQRGRGRARRRTSSTTRTPRRSRRWRCARPRRASSRSGSAPAPRTRAAPSGWRGRRASSPRRSRCRPVVAGINHCASIQSLRLVDGTDAMPLVLARATRAGRQVGARDLRRAALLLGRTGRSSSRRCSASRSPTRAPPRA